MSVEITTQAEESALLLTYMMKGQTIKVCVYVYVYVYVCVCVCGNECMFVKGVCMCVYVYDNICI